MKSISRFGKLKINVNLKKHYLFSLWLTFWIIITTITAFNTELFHDEAYYWKFSQQLEWGYFDHPPMVALLVKIGFLIFHNEGGVRLMFLILNCLSILLICRLSKSINEKVLVSIIGSIVFLQVYGFFAIPDVPSVFFSIVFYFCYNLYVKKETGLSTISISFSIAALLYSKYHGVLIVFFTLLSNLQLFKRRSMYIIIALVSILMIPHLIWLINHNFISVTYQLFERSQKQYSAYNTFSYLIQPFILMGLAGIHVFVRIIKYKPINQFEKTLKYNFTGTLIFFFIMSFKGRVEGNWTSIAIAPMALIAIKAYELESEKNRVVLYKIFMISYLIYFATLLFFMVDYLPRSISKKTEFHYQKEWSNAIEQVALKKPVVFYNSYQSASKYEFYSGNTSYSLNDAYWRKNQYNIWPIESALQGRNVVVIPNWHEEHFDSVMTPLGVVSYKPVDNYVSYSRVDIKTERKSYYWKKNAVHLVFSTLTKRSNEKINFELNKELPSFLSYQIFKNGIVQKEIITNIKLYNSMIDKPIPINIETGNLVGNYELRISIKTGFFMPTMNSELIQIEISDELF